MKKQTKKGKLTTGKFTVAKLNEASKIRGGHDNDTLGETGEGDSGRFCMPEIPDTE